MRKSTLAALIAAPALALTLTACGPTGASSKDTSSPSGSNAPSSSTSENADEVSDEEFEDYETPASDTLSFGETASYTDGLSINVSEPEAFTPDEWAAGGEGHDQHVKFTITVVNNTGVPFDPSMMYLTMQSGNTEADEVYDTDAGMGGAPSTTLLDGREATFTAGFGVDDPSDLVLEVDPGDWENAATVFVKDGK